MIRDRLVCTGVPAADKFLHAGLASLPVQLSEAAARTAWFDADRRAEELDGFKGSAERRDRTAKVFDERRRELAAAKRAERGAKEAAYQADPGAAALVEGELIAVWSDYHQGRSERRRSVRG
ncbi:hypothetical protein [Microtetraspora malaysiensis]|uniref:Uncharacterized protein n=1 Tax=Microtetraspora malaysiensis TaxID=161358 RepID=A0ABW6SKE3_9ACTN